MTTTRKGMFGTSQMHDFRPAGCAHQWAADHKSEECWTAFLRCNGAPSDQMGMGEFYDWLDGKGAAQ